MSQKWNAWDLYQVFGQDILVQNTYLSLSLDNDYHNWCHAADVVCNLAVVLQTLEDAGYPLSEIEYLAACIAAVVHDAGHPGVTNKSFELLHEVLAEEYPCCFDSFLERHSIALFCRALERPDCQVFPENMAADSCKALREMVEPLVLASDMACHNDLLDEFASLQSPGVRSRSTRHANGSFSSSKRYREAKLDESLFSMLLKIADLGHCSQDFEDHKAWAMALKKTEFKADPTNFQGQVGFFDEVMIPLFKSLAHACPACGGLLDRVQHNRKSGTKE
ncbi:hypothetical protein WJX84_005657 [Apatococcus fuscideae]|uniref:PDEase domain-containing protein n=1 Tax=Apatococcus fuscideae TaxID=2026836 RepID=A0AAW1T2L5_9CHLO